MKGGAPGTFASEQAKSQYALVEAELMPSKCVTEYDRENGEVRIPDGTGLAATEPQNGVDCATGRGPYGTTEGAW